MDFHTKSKLMARIRPLCPRQMANAKRGRTLTPFPWFGLNRKSSALYSVVTEWVSVVVEVGMVP